KMGRCKFLKLCQDGPRVSRIRTLLTHLGQASPETEGSWHGEGNRKDLPTQPNAMQKTTLILQPAPATAPAADHAEPTDEALMALIQKRDEQALTMLYYR